MCYSWEMHPNKPSWNLSPYVEKEANPMCFHVCTFLHQDVTITVRPYCSCVITMRETPRPTEEPCGAIVFCMLSLFFPWECRKGSRMGSRFIECCFGLRRRTGLVGYRGMVWWSVILLWVHSWCFVIFTLPSLFLGSRPQPGWRPYVRPIGAVCLKNGKEWRSHSTVLDFTKLISIVTVNQSLFSINIVRGVGV